MTKFEKESSSLQSPGKLCSGLDSTSAACCYHLPQNIDASAIFLFISTDGPITPTKPYSIRHITARVGAAVVRAAVAEDLAEGCCDVGPRELGSMSEVLHRRRNVIFFLLKPTAVSELCSSCVAVGNSGLRRSENVVPYLQPPCERQINPKNS